MKIIGSIIGLGNPFSGAESLWESFQDKVEAFVNDGEGSSVKQEPVTYRPKWNKVNEVLNGLRPVSDLGCDN